MPLAPNRSGIFALVLAAGAATRFGATKQLANFRGEALVRRAARLASTACDNRTLLVLGHEWRAVYAACAPITGGFVVNTDYATGIGSSIAIGVSAIRHAADAVLILLADQPLVTAEHVQRLQASWSGRDDDIVASGYADTTGVPALFPAASFDRLCSLDGDQGAQKMLHDPQYTLQIVEFADAELDVDTPADLVRPVSTVRN